MSWNTNISEAPEFTNILVTIAGYDKVCIAGRWKNEFFLINDFEQEYEGDNGSVKVIAWQFLPEIFVHFMITET